MARGARKQTGADMAVSVTGIAGPGGAEPGKPVGTVCFGLSAPDEDRAESVQFPGDRDEVRARTVRYALRMLECGLDKA